MVLGLFIMFFLCEGTVKPWNILAVEGLSLQLVATPNYPVAAGQRVDLQCITFTTPYSNTWSWQRQENEMWIEVDGKGSLTLTKPEQSGLYRCQDKGQNTSSPSHSVIIVAMPISVGENLGIAAFIVSLLALFISLAVLLWLGLQISNKLASPNAAAKGFPTEEKPPTGSLPKASCGGDVYMNYSRTNEAYIDLDPTNMTADNVYSSLS